MHHGGPYPATGDAKYTSVGMADPALRPPYLLPNFPDDSPCWN
jgi:hypothetical protein